MGPLTRLPGGDLVRDADRANRTMKKHAADWMGALFGIVAVLPSICSIGTGAGVIIVAGVGWLKTAVWNAPTLRDGLVWAFAWPADSFPRTGYLGADQLLRWALDESSVTLWLVVIGPAAWLVLWILIFNLVMAASPNARR
jgi:hypothetical protein